MIDRVNLKIVSMLMTVMVSGVLVVCGGNDAGSALDPVESTDVVGSPTVAPFLIPSTPTPAPLLAPVDQTVLDLLGAGPRKEFPQELMPGSPELPYDEIKRLWTEYQSNIYLIEDANYILYFCEGGYGATPVNTFSPAAETKGLTWEIIDQTEIPRMEWYEARMVIRDQDGSNSHFQALSPPNVDGSYGDGKKVDQSGPNISYVFEKNDCPPAGDPDAEPTPLPALLESEAQEERELPDALLSGEASIDERAELWTEYLSNTHLIPTGLTYATKLESETPDAKIGGYLISAHRLGGSYDLLLCGDGRYHWLGSAPVNITKYDEPGWRGGQDGDWKVEGTRLQLTPDDPRVILKAVSFPLEIEDGQLASTLTVQWRNPTDMTFTVYEASGCP